jgi:hypothetical protein
VNIADRDDETSLYTAVNVVRVQLDWGANPDTRSWNRTPLSDVLWEDNHEMVWMLLEKKNEAFSMALHDCLGRFSQIALLSPETLRIICETVERTE